MLTWIKNMFKKKNEVIEEKHNPCDCCFFELAKGWRCFKCSRIDPNNETDMFIRINPPKDY